MLVAAAMPAEPAASMKRSEGAAAAPDGPAPRPGAAALVALAAMKASTVSTTLVSVSALWSFR